MKLDCFDFKTHSTFASFPLCTVVHKLALNGLNLALVLPRRNGTTLLVKRAREWFQRSA